MASAAPESDSRQDLKAGTHRKPSPGKHVRDLFRRLGTIGDSVMISHTLFSLPFVISAILLETNGHPPFWKLFWIVVAAFGARNAANALNRIIDKDIDAKNPRDRKSVV